MDLLVGGQVARTINLNFFELGSERVIPVTLKNGADAKDEAAIWTSSKWTGYVGIRLAGGGDWTYPGSSSQEGFALGALAGSEEVNLEVWINIVTPGTAQWWLADSLHINTGSIDSGSLEDTKLDDGTFLILAEETGAPGFDYEFWFASVPDTAEDLKINVNGYYEGNPVHVVRIQAWNFNQSQWDNLSEASTDFPSRSTEDSYQFEISPASDYRDLGVVKIRIVHQTAGNPIHDFNIDYLWLQAAGLMPGSPGRTGENYVPLYLGSE